MILVFDLDDTLYDELTYVQSGFRAVAGYLWESGKIPPQDSYQEMMEQLKGGRGHIFDNVLSRFGAYSRKAVQRCVAVYHRHSPDIRMYPEAAECLGRLRHFPRYIVTDGNKIVQKNKLVALGLYDQVHFCFITHRYGLKYAKPSPYCFLKICQRERAVPRDVVYIADNPYKDFVGIKPLGFKTIRIMQGQYKDVAVEPQFDAEYHIGSLKELTEGLIKNVFTSN